MRENPGRWLVWQRQASSGTAGTRLRARGFETTSRSVIVDGVRLFTIYARLPATDEEGVSDD